MSRPPAVTTIVTQVVETIPVTVQAPGQTLTTTSFYTSVLPTSTVVVTIAPSGYSSPTDGGGDPSSTSPPSSGNVKNNSGFSTGAIIGIAVGASILIITIVLGTFLFQLHKRKQAKSEFGENGGLNEAENGGNVMIEARARPYHYRHHSSLLGLVGGGTSAGYGYQDGSGSSPVGSHFTGISRTPGAVNEFGEPLRIASPPAGYVVPNSRRSTTNSEQSASQSASLPSGLGHRRKGLGVSNVSDPLAEEVQGPAVASSSTSGGIFQHTDSGRPVEVHPAPSEVPPSYDSLSRVG